MKKILGSLLIGSPFAGIFIFTSITASVTVAIVSFLITGVVVGVVSLGVCLVCS